MPADFDDQLDSVGVLADPVRRALYRYVSTSPDPVGREEAAESLGLPRPRTKFHLDRLVEAGLLDVVFRRLTGRTGPGAGRPSKLYLRAQRQVSISLPERRYDLASEVLARAIDRAAASGASITESVRQVAHEVGRSIGETGTDSRPGMSGLSDALDAQGYETRVDAGELCLANCPFDRLAKEHTDLACGMNLALIEGVIDGLPAPGATARLQPEDGFCCVRVS
jgi:predicted ArsR family transcriptional regulator